MAHATATVHDQMIVDYDDHFVINPVTRKIEPATPIKNLLVQGDHNSERYTFEVPRRVEGHDESQTDRIMIHFANVGKSGDIIEDVYEVVDSKIIQNENEQDMVVFSWLVSRNACTYEGALTFGIEFSCLDEDGSEVYSWNTEIYTSIVVRKGMSNEVSVVDSFSDVLESWRRELFYSPINLKDQILKELVRKGEDVVNSIPESYFTFVENQNERLSHLVEVSEEQPESEDNRIWVKPTGESVQLLELSDIDNTLSKAGKVADAKATGDRINKVKRDLEETESRLSESIAEIENGIINGSAKYFFTSAQGAILADGTENDSTTSYKMVDFLDVNNIDSVVVTKEIGTAYISFYNVSDGEKVFVKRVAYNKGDDVQFQKYAYIRLSVYLATGANEELLRNAFVVTVKSFFSAQKELNETFSFELNQSKQHRKPFVFSKTITMVKGSKTLQPYTISELKERIDDCAEMHIDTICASVLVSPSVEQKEAFENGSISANQLVANICPSIETINQFMAYAVEKGLKCSVLQIHSEWLRDMQKDRRLTFEEMNRVYKNGVENVLNNMIDKFEYVGVYNEYDEEILSNTNNRTEILQTLNLVKSYTKVGLSGCAVIDNTLLKNVNVYLPHTYIQPFVYFGKYSSLNDAIEKIKSNNVWRRIDYAKNYRSDLVIIASEFGTQSGWECLFNPGTYHESSSFTLVESGDPQIFYLKAMLPFFKKHAVSVASYWWTLYGDAKNYVKAYNDCEVDL